MKTATLPPLRVEPELRARALRALRVGETLSSFVEEAVREHLEQRLTQAEFVRRGLASAREAGKTGVYFTADEVMTSLRRISKRAAQKPPGHRKAAR